MSGAQELAVREKQELANKEEKTIPGRFFIPTTDIFETDEALTVVMEMPGVQKTTSASRWRMIRCASKDGSIFRSTRGWSLSIPSTLSVITRAGSRFRARSTAMASAHSLMTAC